MAFECLRQLFISMLCKGDDESVRLPDCIVIDILNRLPIEVVVRCQSKRDYLGALISSRDFKTLHLSKANARGPMLLLRDSTRTNKKLYVVTNYLTKPHYLTKPVNMENLYLHSQLLVNNKKYQGVHPPHIRFSCEGVILFVNDARCGKICYVLNPTTQEEVIVQRTDHNLLCALYYCPVDHQFKLLSAGVINGSLVVYLVYTFKTQTWREIRGTSVNLLPLYKKGSPAMVNRALHWITHYDLQNKPSCDNNGILIFKMDNEQIYAKPHPGSVCNINEHKSMMTLLVMENNLCFCHLLASQPALALDIWILEHYKKWTWNKTYNINLTPYGPGRNPDYLHRIMKPLYIQDGIFLFYFKADKYLFLYDLRHKTLNPVQLPQMIKFRPFGSYIKTLLPIVA